MRLKEILQEDEERSYKNPLKSIKISNPLFGKVFDAVDDAIYDRIISLGLEDKFKASISRQANQLTLRIRAEMVNKESVPFDKTVATETHLDKAHLDRIMAGDRKSELPFVALYKGKYFILDGNHRAAADFLSGNKSFDADVIKI